MEKDIPGLALHKRVAIRRRRRGPLSSRPKCGSFSVFHPPALPESSAGVRWVGRGKDSRRKLFMICVSIARGRHRHVMAEHRHLVQQGAKLVELRLDYINGEVNLRRLITERALAGGDHLPARGRRRQIHRHRGSPAAAAADGDRRRGRIRRSGRGHRRPIPRFGKTKRIVSLHDFRKTPDEPGRDSRPAGGARCRHRQDGHDGQSAARQPADARI